MAEPRDDYSTLLDRLANQLPRVEEALRGADRARTESLRSLQEGARLRGVNDFLVYLDATATRYEDHEDLSKLAFLVRRASADYETALEATLSGYIGVATDAMRDVLEIEYLLLDFAVVDQADLDVWLAGSDEKRFRPAALRRRLRDAGVEQFTRSVTEGTDYAAHSAALHVSPQQSIIGHKGRTSDTWETDAGFWEIFEHARRLALAVEACGLAFVGEGWADHERPSLSRVADAHDRTQEMQTIYLTLLTAPGDLRKKLGREPSTAELQAYVRDQLTDDDEGS